MTWLSPLSFPNTILPFLRHKKLRKKNTVQRSPTWIWLLASLVDGQAYSTLHHQNPKHPEHPSASPVWHIYICTFLNPIQIHIYSSSFILPSGTSYVSLANSPVSFISFLSVWFFFFLSSSNWNLAISWRTLSEMGMIYFTSHDIQAWKCHPRCLKLLYLQAK